MYVENFTLRTSSFFMKYIYHFYLQLEKATELIDTALDCFPGIDTGSEVVAACLGLVASDLRRLFDLYGSKVTWLLHEQTNGSVFQEWTGTDRNRVLNSIKDAYESR